MHILMCCPNISPHRPLRGGAERQAERLARALQARGLSVSMLTLQNEANWPLRECVDGLSVHRIPVSDLTGWLPRGAGVPNLLLRWYHIRRYARTHLLTADVVHCHSGTSLTAIVAAEASRLGKPVVCKIASGGRTFDLKSLRGTTVIAPSLLLPRMMDAVDRWVALSREIREDLVACHVPIERIVNIPNSVEMVEIAPVPRSALARRFLYLARFTADRDVGTLLNAFEILTGSVPDAELALVGGGELTSDILAVVDTLRAKDRIQVRGHSDPRTWLEWADVVIQPSKSEGMSNTLLEAMAAGRACVASDIPPNRELLADGSLGLLFVPGDAPSLAAAMSYLALVEGSIYDMGARARGAIRDRYDIHLIARQYDLLYHSLVT